MFCFTKIRRLLCKKDYDYVFKKSTKAVTVGFIVLYRPNDLGVARLGLALSKKHIAKACQRNRIKRLLRESFRQQSLPAMDIIFLARSGVAKIDNKSLVINICSIWDVLQARHAG